jgi:hypothetical protein
MSVPRNRITMIDYYGYGYGYSSYDLVLVLWWCAVAVESLHRVFFLVNCRSREMVVLQAILWWKEAFSSVAEVVVVVESGAGLES